MNAARRKERLLGLALILSLALGLSALLWLVLMLGLQILPSTWLKQWELWHQQPWRESMSEIQSWAKNIPALPVYFLLLQVAQVLLAPIPGQFMGLLGGWLFGFWEGLALSILGLTLGSGLAMWLGRWGRRWLLTKLLPSHVLLRFEHLLESGGLFSFFMVFLLPALPDDAICLIAGMTRLNLWALLGVCVLGRLPGMAVLTWVGSSFATEATWLMNGFLLALGLLSALLWWHQDRLEAGLSQWLKRHKA